MGQLRLRLGKQLNLIDNKRYDLLWVTEFPLLEWSDEENRFLAMHHPFTNVMEEDIPLMDTDPGAVRAKAYDLVMNGVEMGSGSIRIHQSDVQEKMFAARWFRLRHRPHGHDPQRRGKPARCAGLPQDSKRRLPHDGHALRRAARAAGAAEDSLRGITKYRASIVKPRLICYTIR